MIFEGWGIGHWRGSGYGKGLGGRTHLTIHCSVFFGLSFHDGNICEWERVKSLGVGVILLEIHNFGGDIKAKKSRGVPRVAESVYSTKLKKKIPYTSPTTGRLSQESVETQEVHPTSSVMDHHLMRISRFPRS